MYLALISTSISVWWMKPRRVSLNITIESKQVYDHKGYYQMTNKMYICWVGVNRYWSPRLLKMLVLAINNKSLQQKISTRKCTTEWFHKNMPNRFSPGLGHPMALNLWGAPSRPGSGLAQARAYLLGPGHQKQGERESVFYFYSAQLEF